MSSRQKKPDARALFKQVKSQKSESSASGSVRRAAPTKYQGMSKEQMLAILRAKKAGNTPGQKAKQSASIPSSVEAPRRASSSPPPLQTQRAKGAAKAAPSIPKGNVQAGSGGLTGLLGISAGDNSSEDDDESNNGHDEGRTTSSSGLGETKTKTPPANSKLAASVPEGLPAGFFDEDVEPSEGIVGEGQEVEGVGDRGDEAEGRAIAGAEAGGFGPERAAQLAAEAAAEAEADAVREAERLAALKAAGALRTVVEDAGASVGSGDVGETKAEEGEPAPNGSALPEGFFDDPEVDAKSRGVDLRAKKKEEEQNDWEEFMSFAEEVKKAEKEEEQEGEAVEEDKEQYEEFEQATMMGRLAVLMNKFESVGHKRKHASSSEGGRTGGEYLQSESDKDNSNGGDANKGAIEREVEGRREEERGQEASSFRRKASEGRREDVEMSVEKTGSAMREVAVASAPTDAAASDISNMLRGRKRKKKKELEEAFAGEYVPMDPLDWRARGR